MPENQFFEICTHDQSLFFTGELTILSVHSFRVEFEKLKSQLWDSRHREINISLSSCGGDVSSGLRLYDLINSSKRDFEIIITAEGECSSAATYCLCAATKSQSFSNTSFILHEIFGVFQGDSSQNRKYLNYTDKLTERILSIYQSKTNKITLKMLKKEQYLIGKEALELGLIDVIV